jgi:hypothetical protein
MANLPRKVSKNDYPMRPGLSGEQSRAIPAPIDGGVPPRGALTNMYTLFTNGLGESVLILEAGDWMKVTLVLETAGPVAISTRSDVIPVLSGKGGLLQTNVPREYHLSRGDRLYYGSNAVNRVNVTVESIPYGNAIVELVAGLGGSINKLVGALVRVLTRKG